MLFSTAEGNYEFYRDGRMILKRPAVLGRNAISVNDLPGGYYSVEVRLVDRNGNIINRENHAISNVNFGGYPGYVAFKIRRWVKSLAAMGICWKVGLAVMYCGFSSMEPLSEVHKGNGLPKGISPVPTRWGMSRSFQRLA